MPTPDQSAVIHPTNGRKGVALLLIGALIMLLTGLTLSLDVMFLMTPEGTGSFGILTFPLPLFGLGLGTFLIGLGRLRRSCRSANNGGK